MVWLWRLKGVHLEFSTSLEKAAVVAIIHSYYKGGSIVLARKLEFCGRKTPGKCNRGRSEIHVCVQLRGLDFHFTCIHLF